MTGPGRPWCPAVPEPGEATITKRALVTVPSILLALTLTACGSSEESTGSAGDSASGSGSAESSAPAEPDATPADYAALVTTLFAQQEAVEKATSAEDFNRQADFPDGISIAEFDEKNRKLCLQDEGKDISVDFDVSDDEAFVASTGLCDDQEEVARLVSDESTKDGIGIEGDREVGAAIKQAFVDKFGA
ncbi:hypothetical protein [Nocardioides aurantiacus]|uniref:Uncharacterized protein n=1 Tax=Nocardioides aurantiacus TaxID=86796 RepID=A0A3N2CYU5_9ACTN|nr:hypothetical protein [Nocardioides aurantiacus]ROR92633.1 hypothetical protein EDD33_3530 [Nocardioides aurantiacus]